MNKIGLANLFGEFSIEQLANRDLQTSALGFFGQNIVYVGLVDLFTDWNFISPN